jgi:hypothetical protein
MLDALNEWEVTGELGLYLLFNKHSNTIQKCISNQRRTMGARQDFIP